MFRTGSLTLFRVRGIPIRAHWTLLFLVPYVAFALAFQLRSIAELAGIDHADLVLPPLAWGAIVAVGLLVSITLHELAHAFVAIRFGGRVASITLMLVGGVAQLERPPAHHEAMMAGAGPATSLALGGACFAAYTLGWLAPDLRMVLFDLAIVNTTLGVFNLVPAFPLDGGRVLRALLVPRIGRSRATIAAATVGKAFAVAFAMLGVWSSNLMLVVVAVFVYTAAQGEVAVDRVREALAELRVADLVPADRPAPLIGSDAWVDGALRRMRALGRLELLAVDRDGAPLAVIQASDLETVGISQWTELPLAALAARIPRRYITSSPDAAATEALDRAAQANVTHVVVVDPAGHAIGLVTGEDVGRMVALARRPGPARLPAEPAWPVRQP